MVWQAAVPWLSRRRGSPLRNCGVLE
jgi:hypothetical protein